MDHQDTTIRRRATLLVAVQSIGILAMIGLTYRLWFPTLADDVFVLGSIPLPVIPSMESLVGVSPIWSWLFSIAVMCCAVIGRVCLLFNWPKRARSVYLILAIAFVVCVLLNQHRFLPWVWHSILLFVGFGLLKEKEFLRFGRILTVTIYIYSAIAKLDYQFVKTTGRQILQTMTSFVGLDSTNWSEPWTNLIVLCFPLTELLIGIGLLFGATRLLAMLGGMGMHLSLVFVLGPFGMDNAESVLVWNWLFVFHLYLLYWPVRQVEHKPESEPDKLTSTLPSRAQTSATWYVLVIFVSVFPALEKMNYVDHWPAWGLYSPNASRCRLRVPRWRVEQLPDHAKKWFGRPASGPAELCEFQLARWSIQELNTPIYPQDRFQFAVARYLIYKLNLIRSFELEIRSASHWWTGRRNIKRITNIDQMEAAKNQFWGNSDFDLQTEK